MIYMEISRNSGTEYLNRILNFQYSGKLKFRRQADNVSTYSYKKGAGLKLSKKIITVNQPSTLRPVESGVSSGAGGWNIPNNRDNNKPNTNQPG